MYEALTGIGVKLQGHLRIVEYADRTAYLENRPSKILLNKRNAIHKDNAAILAIRAMTNQPIGHIAYMVFGNGGTILDHTGTCVMLHPNQFGMSANLYNPVFFQLVDDTLGALPGNQMGVRHISGTRFTDADIRCLIGVNEPFGQRGSNTDALINLNTDTFSFDEIGLKLIDGTLLTHVIFSPVLKTASSLLEVIYTIRIAIDQPIYQTLPSLIGQQVITQVGSFLELNDHFLIGQQATTHLGSFLKLNDHFLIGQQATTHFGSFLRSLNPILVGQHVTTTTGTLEITVSDMPVEVGVEAITQIGDFTKLNEYFLIGEQSTTQIATLETPPNIVYSVRLAIPSYAGPLYTLRRDSDNATMAFFPDISGDSPVSAINAWLAGANGFVTTWNDQGPHSLNIINTHTAQQPQWIASANAGRPGVEFGLVPGTRTAQQSLAGSISFVGIFNTGMTIFGMMGLQGVGNWSQFSSGNSYNPVLAVVAGGSLDVAPLTFLNGSSFGAFGPFSLGAFEGVANYGQDVSGNETAATFACTIDTGFHLWDTLIEVGSTDCYEDSVSLTAGNMIDTGAFPSLDSFIVVMSPSGLLQGTVQEVQIYPTGDAINRAGVRANIEAYY